ncbi:thioredoxin-dependent thiol peroxidase [Rubrivirga sp. SAORIC476]|uniref:thioredoxin-dependent thiol peroxidase n=1 Tax=Rubrivirga sp. SAORIC476 TaxID=1961794 RepID=UPI000BA8E696|nr:thioredoxin-dependent thiol peroxidase [Rubrivirga sp. SAORIC476]PAP74904.1 thioredoxin-dependent thiol peroxidase [Rubrivirga sp. SAORIC476]
MPAPGDLAPAFEGIDQTGATVRLADFAGKPLALYFYPKDDTPGCTKQACNLRDHTGDLTEAGVAVVGVSADPVESHERFAAKYDLLFPLLADPEHEILEAYGAWGEKNLYGRKSMGTKRTTFLIGADGRVIHVFKRPKTDRHAEEILAKLPA